MDVVEGLIRYVLRRWLLLVAGFALGGLLGFLVTATHQDAYVAQSLVVMTNSQIPTTQFVDTARSVFATDAVLSPVISALGITNQTPRGLISSGALSVVGTPGGGAVQVVARTQDPALTVNLANEAANSLAKVAQDNQLGTFAPFTTEGPARRQADPVFRYTLAGALLGVIVVGLGLMLWYVFRHGLSLARDPLRADAMFRVQVRPADSGGEMNGEAHPLGFAPEYALPALLQGIASEAGGGPVIGVVVDDGRDMWAPLALAEHLASITERDGAASFRWSRSSEPVPQTDAACVAVIASERASTSRLHDIARQLDDVGEPYLVLVRVSGSEVSS
jgi:capsular polysaccharide biosynthesis protein